MKRIGLLGAVALLLPVVPSTPAIAIPSAWNGFTCINLSNEFETCYFQSRGECQYWNAQTRRDHPELVIGRCEASNDPLGVDAEWEFDLIG